MSKHSRNKPKNKVPLLMINDDEPQENKKSLALDIESTISNHISSRINNWLKYWGFRNSPEWVVAFVITILIVNLITNAVTIKNSVYCIYLNICVLTFQAESVILYVFAWYSVTKQFIKKVVSQLTDIDICSRQFQLTIDKYTNNNHVQIQNKNKNKNEDNEAGLIVSSLKFGKVPHHRSTSVKIYEEYKYITDKRGFTILTCETVKCLLV